MQVNLLPNTTKQCDVSFKARHIANAVTNLNNIKQLVQLYSLDESDLKFAQKMRRKINLEKLYKSNEQMRAWYDIINDAIQTIGKQPVVLAVHNKRPCGIMSYTKEGDDFILSYLAKWRTKQGVDTNFVGKILMRKFFQEAHTRKIKSVVVTPSIKNPRGKSCKSFYSDLGFKEINSVKWQIKNENFQKKCAQLENFFEYKEIDSKVNINPFSQFSLKFYETTWEKLRRKVGLSQEKF